VAKSPPSPHTLIYCEIQPQYGLSNLFQDAIETTGTFKHRKVTLMEEGFNPEVVKDPLYFLDDKTNTYVPMTEDIYDAISAKSLKL
jgi:hypothetical protein